MSPDDKPLVWLHREIQTPPFSANARVEAGVLLRRLQEHTIDLPEAKMNREKATRLRKAGWRIGTAEEFLELSPGEVAIVELKLDLAEKLREQRTERGLTQTELARRLGSSQSRVAKMEASDPTVSVDLLLRGLFAVGASRSEVAGAIGRTRRRARTS